MEENLTAILKDDFELEQVDLKNYSPITLAYIGDAVFDLIIKTVVVNKANCAAKKLHARTSRIVNAKSQSDIIEVIRPLLTEEEEAIYKRGRNSYSASRAKNQTMSDYRRATGFEALMGYLYMTGRYERMMELVKTGLTKLEKYPGL